MPPLPKPTSRPLNANAASGEARAGNGSLLQKYLLLGVIANDPALTRVDIAVAWTLLEWYGSQMSGWTVASYGALAKAARADRSTAYRSVLQLMNRGYIQLQSGGEHRQRNLYQPNFTLTNTSTIGATAHSTIGKHAHSTIGATAYEEEPLKNPLRNPPASRERARHGGSPVGVRRAKARPAPKPQSSWSEKTRVSARDALAAYQPSAETYAFLSENCAGVPDATSPRHVQKFINHRLATGRIPRGPAALDADFKLWMAREQEFAERDRNKPSRKKTGLFDAAMAIVTKRKNQS